MGKIVVVGSLNMDLVAVAPRVPRSGETLMGTDFFQTPGGKGANQAYAASKLGGTVAMIGKVGTDEFGAILKAQLAGAGCDVSRVIESKGNSGVAMISVGADSQNSIVIVPGANARLSADDVAQAESVFAEAKVVLLQLENPISTVVAAARAAKAAGATVILDPAPAPAGLLPSELLGCVDIITPNEVEALGLLGEAGNELDTEAAIAAAREIQKHGVPRIIIKLGAQGCAVLDRDRVEVISAPLVHSIDSTAAGDTFNGALAVGLAEGQTLLFACRLAVAAAALSVTKLGAQASMPNRFAADAVLLGKR